MALFIYRIIDFLLLNTAFTGTLYCFLPFINLRKYIEMECPIEPDQSECCNSGCNPCIFDVYDQQLKKYEKSLIDQQTIKVNCLKELKYVPFVLVNLIQDSENSNIYIFECKIDHTASNECNVFLEPGQHLLIRMKSHYDGNDFTRAYTPIPWEGLSNRQFAVLIKLYSNGDMSTCIKQMKIGDITYWRGPYGDYLIDYKQKGLLMIAQGTGVAPLYAVSRKVLDNDDTELRIRMIYCCQSLRQMHLRNELYALRQNWNFKYEVYLSQGLNSIKMLDMSNVGVVQHDLKHITENEKTKEVELSPKYNEMLHVERLNEEDIAILLQQHGDECSEVLICGSEVFAQAMEKIVKKYSALPIHTF